MDDQLKQKLDDALKNGKATVDNIGNIVKNITKEMMDKSKGEGDELKKDASDLFKEIVNTLCELGKGSFEFIKAAGAGFVEGLKESGKDDNNMFKQAGTSILEGLKSIGSAGIYVTKETAKNLSSTIESLLKKAKEQKNGEESSESSADEQNPPKDAE